MPVSYTAVSTTCLSHILGTDIYRDTAAAAAATAAAEHTTPGTAGTALQAHTSIHLVYKMEEWSR